MGCGPQTFWKTERLSEVSGRRNMASFLTTQFSVSTHHYQIFEFIYFPQLSFLFKCYFAKLAVSTIVKFRQFINFFISYFEFFLPNHCRCRELWLYLITHNARKKQASSGGIRTRSPSKQAVADPRVTPRGHRDRLIN